jgi:hypothetical protein
VIAVANTRQRLSNERGNLYVCLGRNLTHDMHESAGDNRFNRYPRGGIDGEKGVQNVIRNLIAHFVGVAFSNGL